MGYILSGNKVKNGENRYEWLHAAMRHNPCYRELPAGPAQARFSSGGGIKDDYLVEHEYCLK